MMIVRLFLHAQFTCLVNKGLVPGSPMFVGIHKISKIQSSIESAAAPLCFLYELHQAWQLLPLFKRLDTLHEEPKFKLSNKDCCFFDAGNGSIEAMQTTQILP